MPYVMYIENYTSLTTVSYFRDCDSFLIGHETKDRKNGKTGINTGSTVDQGNYKTVPKIKMGDD